MRTSSCEAELDALLNEPVSCAQQRALTAFDEHVQPYGQKVVLFGAGNMGRQVLARLRQDGIEPLAFSDNSQRAWGTVVDGLPVLPPEEAATQHGRESVFVVTIYNHRHSFPDTRQQLTELGCVGVVSVIPLRWKYHETFLPYYRDDLPHKVLEQADEIRDALALYADDASRREFVAQVRWRLHGDFDVLSPPSGDQQYFPKGEIFRLGSEEFFVDVGAYDGDTVALFLARTGGAFSHILALEPDPTNFQKLSSYVASLPKEIRAKVEAKPIAAAATPGRLPFALGQGVSSGLSPSGPIEVECSRLDDVLGARRPTYIKLDVEGAELDAIHGAPRTLSESRPVVAACVYHAQDHLWKVPAAIRKLNAGYDFFLRPYMTECWETVCYAVPPERLFSNERVVRGC
jgi:FkbM family methyltransferase